MKLIKWLLHLFKIGTQKPEASATVPPIINPEPPTKEEVDNFPKKKIAIIIGHGSGDPGASTWNGSNEFLYNSNVAEYIKANSKHDVKLFYRSSTGIVGVALKAVSWNPDVSIELHLNSYNGKAKGCEVLVLDNDEKSGELARSFAASFTSKFDRVLRGDKGIKWLSSGDRGAASLKVLMPIKQSILVEPFFCDNKEEWLEWDEYAKWLNGWLNDIFN